MASDVLTGDFRATPYWWDLAPRPAVTEEAPPGRRRWWSWGPAMWGSPPR